MAHSAHTGLEMTYGIASTEHSGDADEAGTYLTDGVFLYRLVGAAATPSGDVAEVEDCYWLDVVVVPIRDLRARRLRVVRPA